MHPLGLPLWYWSYAEIADVGGGCSDQLVPKATVNEGLNLPGGSSGISERMSAISLRSVHHILMAPSNGVAHNCAAIIVEGSIIASSVISGWMLLTIFNRFSITSLR